MALADPTQARTSDLNNSTTDYAAGDEPWNRNLNAYNVDSVQTEARVYQCDWPRWHGYYRLIPEARQTIDVWCRWIIGNEIKIKSKNFNPDRIKGIGKDTFRRILMNMKRTSKICGDAYAEIIRDKAGRIINLKPLDPGTIEIQADEFGIIKKYIQYNFKGSEKSTSAIKKVIAEWQPEEIFHLINDRIADEIHGIPEAEKLMKIVKWRHQAMSDISVVYHRYVKPNLDIYANTDDETELESLRVTFDKSTRDFENRIIPKGAIDRVERVSIPQNSTLDPLPWIILLRDYFVLSSGVPDIILGHSRETSLAAGKLNYLAFKEKIIQEQNDFEEDIKSQLGIELEFAEPREIDIEISRTQDQMNLKTKAKQQKGGEQIINDNVRTSS